MSPVIAITYVMLWAIVLLLVVLVLVMARQLGILYTRIPPFGAMETSSGPEIGQPAPVTVATDTHGSSVTLGSPHNSFQLVVFMSPGCITCKELAPAIRTFAKAEPDEIQTIVVTGDLEAERVRDFTKEFRFGGLSIVPSSTIVGTFSIKGTPYAVLISREGRIAAKGIVNNLEQLEGLVESARQRTSVVDWHQTAESLPIAVLPNGAEVP